MTIENGPKGPKKIGDLLSLVLAKHGYGQISARIELEKAWREAIGERLAPKTKVGSIRQGIIEVLVENATLLSELQNFQRPKLLGELKKRVQSTNIRDLKFRRM